MDSLDFARYSDDGNRESDERVAGKTGKKSSTKTRTSVARVGGDRRGEET